jgi:hypothetical protein
VALPKGHKAARKRSVALRDFDGELFMIPSKDMFPSLHQLVASAFLQNHVPLNRYQNGGAFSNCGGSRHGPCWICVPSIFGQEFCPRRCRFTSSELFDRSVGHICSVVARES